jgi:hypothetical protein
MNSRRGTPEISAVWRAGFCCRATRGTAASVTGSRYYAVAALQCPLSADGKDGSGTLPPQSKKEALQRDGWRAFSFFSVLINIICDDE